MHVYEVRPRKDHPDVNLISDALPFGRLWYDEPSAVSNAVDYTKSYSRSHNAVIRVYDEAGKLQKRSQLFIRVHNETFSVAAMRVCNPDCSALGIDG
jgi:hypothetical protein